MTVLNQFGRVLMKKILVPGKQAHMTPVQASMPDQTIRSCQSYVVLGLLRVAILESAHNRTILMAVTKTPAPNMMSTRIFLLQE